MDPVISKFIQLSRAEKAEFLQGCKAKRISEKNSFSFLFYTPAESQALRDLCWEGGDPKQADRIHASARARQGNA